MKIRLLTFFSICCLFLTSCSGLKNIQDLTYIVAIGLDYDEVKQEYKAYIQSINFANVAKQEGAKSIEPIPSFIATATGETLNLAVSKLYKKSKPPLFFGHTLSLVLSENLVKNKFDEVITEIGRNRSLRPTLRLLVAKENIEEILNTKALFNYPSVYSVIYKHSSEQISQNEITPILLMDFLRDYYEPMGTAKLPSVKIDQDTWKAEQNYPVLYFDGYTVFQNQEYITTLAFKDAFLANWLLEDNIIFDHKVEKNGQLLAAISLTLSKFKIKFQKSEQSPAFSIEVSVQGDLLEKIKDIPTEELINLIEKDLEKRITELYDFGVENNMDILNTGVKWYRNHPKKFKELNDLNSFYLEKDSLTAVKVDVQIVNQNTYKYDLKSSQ
ncbi:Ger(x)C family spore germination protein [Bacillus mesophilum]|uniref:Ger(X)C family spore germination protein n=1 Tax=Bacillus mesophilum TaxID=1071718 RepID=A0A7V7UXA3_9BACI|nr:Ger(x)C family spore germination protein [Bacillus mesophilum]KAB2335666.1 Ger(x)C family spore germination protein [Bacillus mesophilum]